MARDSQIALCECKSPLSKILLRNLFTVYQFIELLLKLTIRCFLIGVIRNYLFRWKKVWRAPQRPTIIESKLSV